MIAHRFPTWKLKLVGNVDPLFDGYLKMFRKQHKDIADRIIFTGSISDKIALFDEYQKAKIFALPSRLEGGAPNVIGEALHCGCAAAVAAFDAWEDVIDQGRCGMASLINDIDGFANALATMCSDEIKLQSMCEHAFRYAHSMFSMEKIVSRLHESILEVHHE